MAPSKIVIFGGAFNPPTVAHEAIIAALLKLPDFTAVWIMPSGDRLDKKIGVSDHQRLTMLELMKKERFGDDSRLVISDFELTLPRPTATYSTLAKLEKAYPQAEFWFAYGADSYISMPSWPHGTTLRARLKIVLFSSGGPLVPIEGTGIHLDIPAMFGETSSTEARHLAAQGKPLGKIVSQSITHYMQKNQLYR